ncbi:hypothetical protein QBC34DRAFT_320236 [Podospora aff. communis PSN243]|uniref:Enoyl reductase (ER) domain-containing protein n=1 Tax=Podospora aff. communis PSN243 TaxID=3040156 RepID=A0AAV9GX69_9PEZI|nr:hypothetical protein QBC34DRAFT_320236 [Podospora aff. communis PSN243]
MTTNTPKTMRAWQFTSTTPTLHQNLTLHTLPIPTPTPTNPILIRVLSTSLNPIDYKLPSLPLLGRLLIPRPATPGSDFCGRIITIHPPSSQTTPLKQGDLIFGRLGAPQHGTLAEYITVPASACVLAPEGVHPDVLAAVPTAGLAAFQVLHNANLKAGDKVFINGGAGGTGTMGIQIAKAMGCHVTTSCSGGKRALCERLGADEVVDYTREDVVGVLEGKGRVFSLVVDNVGGTGGLYRASGGFLVKGERFVQVGMPMGLQSMLAVAGRMLLSVFSMAGSRGKFEMFAVKGAGEDLGKLGEMVAERKVVPHVERVYEFESVPDAYEKLRGGHCEGKLVVHVGDRERG